MIREFDGHKPDIHPTAYVHETAEVIGRVRLGPRVSLWPYVVLRGDVEEIVVGEGTNIQDNTVVHTDHGVPTTLGRFISVGHSAILHGCRVGDHALIGMGSIVLNNAVVEEEALVGAGALVPPGLRVTARHLAVGVPAKVIRPLTPEEIRHNRENAEHYLDVMKKHASTSRPVPRTNPAG
jgi:carbonic anhydrase/acetyltransferase-like protein (isoleucine patch superfamily)